jgi:acetoacetyl-CoA synthetase
MTYAIEAQPLWQPNPQTVGQTRMAQFMRSEGYESYADLWQWSVDMPEVFWSSLWNYCGVVGEKGTKILVDRDRMPGAGWFPEARLNYAENLLQQRDACEALVFWGEDKVRRRLSRNEL